jgi:hypothetical protein
MISSVEYRVIRGELQDAAQWTARNWIIRAATLVGAVGTGVPAFASTNAVKYVSAYNGAFVPGLAIFWPDPTVAQLNHVSDLGYQTNKVFPKDSADVVYAFFPLDRILTPTLKRIFLTTPALFMYPSELFIDNGIGSSKASCFFRRFCTTTSDIDMVRGTLMNLIGAQTAADVKTKGLRLLACSTLETPASGKQTADKAVNNSANATGQTSTPPPCTQGEQQQATLLQQALYDISMSRIAVTVAGVMSVNTQNVAASVDEITINSGDDKKTWTASTSACASLEGTVTGRYLTGGQVTVGEMTVPGPNGTSQKPTDYFDTLPFTTATDSATDSTFTFSGSVKTTIPNGTVLQLTVVKPNPDKTAKNRTIQSNDYQYDVQYTGGPAPGATVTVISTACRDRTAGVGGSALTNSSITPAGQTESPNSTSATTGQAAPAK